MLNYSLSDTLILITNELKNDKKHSKNTQGFGCKP